MDGAAVHGAGHRTGLLAGAASHVADPFVSNALPNVAGMGSVETAFLLVYSSFLPDASSMSLLMFYRLASYYAVFAASAVGFGLAQRRLSRE